MELAIILACCLLVNMAWMASLLTWPRIPLEYTITATIMLTSLATVCTAWQWIGHP